MQYQEYLIADFNDGIRQDKEPWRIPTESFRDLLNVYFWRGSMRKRHGYSYFGRVQDPTAVVAEVIVASAPGGTKAFSGTLAHAPVAAGSLTTTDDAGPQETFTDNGNGTLTGSAGGSGTINYYTGAWTLTYFANLAIGSVISASYTYGVDSTNADKTIRGLFDLESAIQDDVGIACDRQNLSVWDASNKYYGLIPLRFAGTYDYFGNSDDLCFGASFNDQQYVLDGTSSTSSGIWTYDPNISPPAIRQRYLAKGQGTSVGPENIGPGTGVATYTGTLAAPPVREGSLTIADATGPAVDTFTDNGDCTLTGDNGGTGTIDYITGDYSITFSGVVGAVAINANYYTNTTYVKKAQLIFPYYRRLVLLNTSETANGTDFNEYRQRMRWNKIDGTYQWLADVGGQGSSLDAATNESIVSGGIVNGVLVVAFERSIWIVEYTGNSSVPFRWRKLKGDLEINSVFATFTTRDMVVFVGHGGIYGCNGVEVKKIDDKIPDFTVDGLSIDNINKCVSIWDDSLDQGMMFYPAEGEDDNDGCLVVNPEKGWFSKYDYGMTATGRYIRDVSTTWTLLIAKYGATWDEPPSDLLDKRWRDVIVQKDEDAILGGGASGYVYLLNDSQNSWDEPLNVATNYDYNIFSKRFSPYLDEGQKSTLGYVDVLIKKLESCTAKFHFMSSQSDGIYLNKDLDMSSDRGDDLVWKRVTINHSDNEHSFSIDGLSERSDIEFHAFVLGFKPSGTRRTR